MPETKKTAKELLKEVQAETIAKVNESRFNLLLAHDEADELNAHDDYEIGLVEILEKHQAAIELWKLQRVFPDVTKLRLAKEALHKAGKIQEGKEGTKKVLILIKK